MATHEAALLELLARGKKDAFFHAQGLGDTPTGTQFYTSYPFEIPHIRQTVQLLPSSPVNWNGFAEFDLQQIVSEFVKDLRLEIRLTSWLPDSVLSTLYRASTTDTDGNVYGYVNGIGWSLFQSIQLRINHDIVSTWDARALDWVAHTTASEDQTLLTDALVGRHSGSTADIGRNAWPNNGRLTVRLPLVDPSHPLGFPLAACRGSSIAVRIYLRAADQVIESAPTRGLLPFSKSMTLVRRDESNATVVCKSAEKFAPPDIRLQGTGVFVDPKYRTAFTTPFLSPIRYVQSSDFAIDRRLLDEAAVLGSGQAMATYPLEFARPVAQIVVVFFRRCNPILFDYGVTRYGQIGRGGALESGAGGQTTLTDTYITDVKLTLHGRERFIEYPASFYRDFASIEGADAGMRDYDKNAYVFNFTMDGGARRGQPMGTANFSEVTKADLYLRLRNVTPSSDEIIMRVYAFGWNMLQIDKGKLRVRHL